MKNLFMSTILVSMLLQINLPTVLANFRGPGSHTKLNTIKTVLKMKDDTQVTLEGYIIRKINSEHYMFKDKTGQIQIEIDGGINFENSKKAIKAGVNILISGTAIFKENEGNLKKNIQLLRIG